MLVYKCSLYQKIYTLVVPPVIKDGPHSENCFVTVAMDCNDYNIMQLDWKYTGRRFCTITVAREDSSFQEVKWYYQRGII